MRRAGRQWIRIAAVVFAPTVASCAGEVVPAAPNSFDDDFGPIVDAPSPGTEAAGANAYTASCKTIEEPNGPYDSPDPFYFYRSTELVETTPGQEVTVIKCGRFYRQFGRLYQLPDEECSSTIRTMSTGSLEVLCHELKDFRGLPGEQEGDLEEVGWTEIRIEMSSTPTEVDCDHELEIVPEDESNLTSIRQQFTPIEWRQDRTIAVTKCQCYQDDGHIQTPTREGCETVRYGRPAENQDDPYRLICTSVRNYDDRESVETTCLSNSYRYSTRSVGASQED